MKSSKEKNKGEIEKKKRIRYIYFFLLDKERKLKELEEKRVALLWRYSAWGLMTCCV